MERVEVGGGEVEYQFTGPSHSPVTLVFLHEGLGCAAMWGRFPHALSIAVGCRTLVYSRFGYGGSAPLPRPRTDRFMHDEALDVLPALLNRLGIGLPLLVGQSDGASIALIYAAAHPGSVAGLVLEAPHVFAEARTREGVARVRRRFEDDEGFREKFGRYHRDARAVVESWSQAWLAPSFASWNVEPLLPAITCPTLLLQSEHDPYGSLVHLDLIARRVRGPVRKVVLPGDGHAPHRDCHTRVLHEMAEFVTAIAHVL